MNKSIDFDKLQKALMAAKRSAAAFGYGTYLDPTPSGPVEPIDVTKPVPLRQWLLEPSDFIDVVCREIPEMPMGEVRQLMTGCGAGKTTKMGAAVAKATGWGVMILLPHMLYATANLSRIRDVAFNQYGIDSVALLNESHMSRPLKAPAVYVSGLSEYLAMKSKCTSINKILRLGLLYLDESHVVRPELTVFRYLVSSGRLSDTRVLYGSATAANDISMESNSMREVKAVKQALMPLAPTGLDAKSPAAAQAITSRTLLFVADEVSVSAWVDYYVDNDIPAVGYAESSGTTKFGTVVDFLTTESPRVVVTTGILEPSVTLAVSKVIDLGYTTRMKTDFSSGSISLKTTTVTSSSRTQRAGRVGRFMKGIAYYSNVDLSAPVSENDPDICCYVYLWAKLFGLKIKSKPISTFSQVFDENMSLEVCAMLLHGFLPPYAMYPYMNDDGIAANWSKALKQAFRVNNSLVHSPDNNVDRVNNWDECFTSVTDYCDVPLAYKARVSTPDRWVVLQAYYYFMAYNASVMPSDTSDGVSRFGNHGTGSNKPLRAQRGLSTVSFVTTTPEFDRFSLVGTPPVPPLPVVEEESDAPSFKLGSTSTKSSVTDGISAFNYTASPVRHGGKESKRASRRLSSSGSSGKEDMVVVAVDPVKKFKFKLYPMDDELRKMLISGEAVTAADRSKVRKLMDQRVYISSLHVDADMLRHHQAEYFLATLKVHNSAVLDALQASVTVQRSGWERFMGKAVSTTTHLSMAKDTAGLLRVFVQESFPVGVDSRTLHSSDDSLGVKEPLTELEKMGGVALVMASQAVRDTVDQLQCAHVPLFNGPHRQYVANGWILNGMMVTCDHAYQNLDDVAKDVWLDGCVPKENYSQDLFCAGDIDEGPTVSLRRPVPGELLIVVAYVHGREGLVTYGTATVISVLDEYAMDILLTHGFSGAVCVALSDGAVVGLYGGLLMYTREGIAYSTCLTFF